MKKKKENKNLGLISFDRYLKNNPCELCSLGDNRCVQCNIEHNVITDVRKFDTRPQMMPRNESFMKQTI